MLTSRLVKNLLIVLVLFLPACASNNRFVTAGMNGDMHTIKHLLKKGENINQRDVYGQTALYWAAANGHIDVVRKLIDRGANIDTPAKNGTTALLAAADKGHLDVVEVLLANGADIHHQDNSEQTALIWASWKGHVDIVNALIEKGANVNKTNNFNTTSLEVASELNHIDVVQTLLAHGAEVDKQNKRGETALFWAARKGHASIVSILLKHGADVNNQNDRGETALFWAAHNGHATLVNTLIAHGANVDMDDSNGVTPLMTASEKGRLNIVKILLKSNADFAHSDKHGHTAMSLAKSNGHTMVMKVLAPELKKIKHYKMEITDYTARKIISRNGANGPQTLILIGGKGAFVGSTLNLSIDSIGRPKPNSSLILEPIKGTTANAIFNADNSSLAGTKYAHQKLALEFDARDMTPLLGPGSTFFLRPGVAKIQVGGFFVSTKNATDWCVIKARRYPRPHTISGKKCREWKISGYQIPHIKSPQMPTFVGGAGFALGRGTISTSIYIK